MDEVTHTYVENTNPAVTVLNFILGLISLLLALRFVLKLFAAPGVQIVDFIYNTSDILVQPFYGLFGRTYLSGNPRLDLEALIALVVVWLIGGLLASLLRSFH